MNSIKNTELTVGRVYECQRNLFIVKVNGKEIPAKLKGSFYDMPEGSFPIVGDYVEVMYNTIGESVIYRVCERKSVLKRPDQAKTATMQYMVANADYTFIVTALNEDYSYNRIARYVSVALEGDTIPVVILTKSDCCNNVGRYVSEVEGIADGIKVHAISALYGIGLEEVGEYFKPGVTICLIGSSGAGKSTLINAMAGEEVMKTGAVRESDSTGKHTTTHRQIIDLKCGTSIIDTPGMREIGMANIEEGIDSTFADIIELERQCKFSDCKHKTEPGCAVKAAIERGELARERLELYTSLSIENKNNSGKKKEIAKLQKARKKIVY
ncbi:MAG: ribosome small subunit-dependent GTPase A [Lachnospiraceae bacterium]|nr:ribosome small subunit-dependent GTPase A [Lachnospiraceae bacterium]